MPAYDFAILGGGAIGSIVAAHLARAGHAVAVLARGARAQELSTRGVRISGLQEIVVNPTVICDPAQLRHAQVLLVATKAIGTEVALEPLRGARIGVALSLQNGVMKNGLLGAAFGPQQVLGAIANISGELGPSGIVEFTRNVGVIIGEAEGGVTTRVERLVASLDGAGIRARAHADMPSVEWSKFAAWVGLMALSVTTRLPTWQFLREPDAALAIVRLVREVGALASACSVQLSDESTLPVATICRADDSTATSLVLQHGAVFQATAPSHRVSALQDLDFGRPLEIEETLGFAVARARELGLSLVLLESFHGAIAAVERART